MTPEEAAKMWVSQGKLLSTIRSEISTLQAEEKLITTQLEEARDTLHRSVSNETPKRVYVVGDQALLVERYFSPISADEGSTPGVTISELGPRELIIVE